MSYQIFFVISFIIGFLKMGTITPRVLAKPIQFSIPTQKVVSVIPHKTQDFASLIPGDRSTYVYDDEKAYYADYQRSYFAVTTKKAGWDCLRHYEILANGCIPYFVDLEQCPEQTMVFFPKTLVLEAMRLPGVAYRHIDHATFDTKKYFEILEQLVAYTRQHLTTKALAEYLLQSVGYSGEGKVLFLSNDQFPDYLRCLTLVGLREVLGNRLIDFQKIEHLYKNYPGDEKQLYGKGITYTRLLDDSKIHRDSINTRIKSKEFDLIIYGSVHRGLPFYEHVYTTYEAEKIVYLCGEDSHQCPFQGWLHNLFLREW